MNSKEMVRVPREWAQHYADLLEERCAYEKAEQVTAFLAQPAQHQGGPSAPLPAIPVNLEEQVQMLNRSNTLLRWALKLIAEGWNFKKFKAPYVSESKSSINFGLPDSEGENISVYSDSQDLPGALTEELSVTRPINGFNMGAPVEHDERAEFEKAWAGAVNVEVLDLHRKQFPLTSDADQPYDTPQTQLGWMMWQARAALERKPSRLVAQLQADLTARDERIDELESQLMPDLHSRPEERGTPEVEPCSGCGTPGWTGACNKCIPY